MRTGEALRDPSAERIGHEIEPADVERGEEITQRIGVVRPVGRLRQQVVAQHVARRIPRDYPKVVGEAGEPGHSTGHNFAQRAL